MRILGHLWALPLTAAGLVVALLLGAHPRALRGGALQVVAPRRGPLAMFFRLFGVSAYTWGATIVFRDEAMRAEEWLSRHERVHVRQAMVLGPLLPLAYMAAGVWAVARGGHAYRDNWFEVQARQG